MPKRKSAEDEIDDLVDDLDELDEDDEEVEVEDEDEEEEEEEEEEEDEDEEDEDPDEAPKKRRSKSKKTKSKPVKTGIGTAELAEAAGTDSRTLRMYLRKKGVQARDDRDGRYNWPSLKDREAQRIIKDIQKGAAAEMNKEKLAELKGRKKSTTKKSTKKRARSKK